MINDDEDAENGETKIFDIYQRPDGKWEATVLGTIIDEPCDDINQAILWTLGAIAEAFVMHINEGTGEAHPISLPGYDVQGRDHPIHYNNVYDDRRIGQPVYYNDKEQLVYSDGKRVLGDE